MKAISKWENRERKEKSARSVIPQHGRTSVRLIADILSGGDAGKLAGVNARKKGKKGKKKTGK